MTRRIDWCEHSVSGVQSQIRRVLAKYEIYAEDAMLDLTQLAFELMSNHANEALEKVKEAIDGEERRNVGNRKG